MSEIEMMEMKTGDLVYNKIDRHTYRIKDINSYIYMRRVTNELYESCFERALFMICFIKKNKKPFG